MKSRIVAELGQAGILLPSLIADGLAANDRVKARLSVLQAATRHAHDPHAAGFDLADECRAASLDPMPLEALVRGAAQAPGERVVAPGLDQLESAIWADVETMLSAVQAGEDAHAAAMADRLAHLKAANPPEGSDSMALARIARLTAVSHQRGDSLHRLIMDLHKALNRLSAAHAEEVLAGAHVYGLLPQDRPMVEAFMCGLESTRKLKFDHPGLGTTATRSAARLTIQNDIGETDAHVVVIAVEGSVVTVTYTDVHLARAKFFTNLLRDFPVQWSGLDRKSAAGLGDDGVFYLVTGRLQADDDKQRDGFLAAIGASLVFLIDWNKARKVLRNWVAKSDAIVILDWAARHRYGHRGFLALGGGELVAGAVQHATPTRIGFGERLDHALGRAGAIDFVKTVLRVSAEALLGGSSARLARDRIEADLIRHLQGVETGLLAIVVRQAGLARDIATDLAQLVAEQQARRPFDRHAFAARASHIEQKADRIVIEARNDIARFDADGDIAQLVNSIEDAIDLFEQAAFIASLAPDQMAESLLPPLAELCAAAVAGTEAAATGTTAAADVPNGQRVDVDDTLAAVARLIDAEHTADTAERAVTAIVLKGDFDLKSGLAALEFARAIERATDRLAAFGHLLRARVLADLSA
ncbi:hypothetical protein DW352_03765 [Pseudolabrys taiwanensis]|uniref:Phosphate transport regulator n=1 Tax=Pseudolabrys taiwanensis TaxID=331696 RepID=A0A345ZS16_9HYPH|nr:hypothetical protein [Pseudolabrys taiwanensis]AXK79713.1 hypothetical protein DW352_03765 [Pseudolabrys taiwanensis]